MFITNSAVVLHLEVGSCESGADEDFVTEVAFECYQSSHYTSDNPSFRFQCPTCDTPFSSIGALLQHAESDTCDEHLGKNKALGKFLHYLDKRMRRQQIIKPSLYRSCLEGEGSTELSM
jgi:hypothetical protein